MNTKNEEEPIDWHAVVNEARTVPFQNGDDAGYRAWCAAHPNGFVVDTDTVPPRGEPMVHRATCAHIADWQWLDSHVRSDGKPYSYTSSPNAKICSTNEHALIAHCRRALAEGRDVLRCHDCM